MEISPSIAGAIGIGILLLLMFIGIPIAVSFALVGSAGILFLLGAGKLFYYMGSVPYTWGSSFSLATIPLFVLMGNFSFYAGISRGLYDAAQKWVGHIPGGLAISTVAACAGFAATTGSSLACAAAMGHVALPEMKRHGYDDRIATGVVAAAGTLGILIPPSTGFILYGILTQQSIGKLFMAGIFPGIMVAIIYSIAIYFMVKFKPALAPPIQPVPWQERFVSLKGIWGMILLFLAVMGGIWGGVFTPVEAGGVGAFCAMAIGLVKGQLSKQGISHSLKDTMRVTSMIFLIIVGAMIFNYFLAFSRLPMTISDWLVNVPVSRYVILLGIIIMYLILGMFMELLGMLVLTLPFVFPTIVALGFDPIWFGVIVVRLVEIGLITPPVGMNCYVIAGVSKDVPLSAIFRGALPFVLLEIPILTILVIFPSFVLLLPNLMK